MYSLLVVKEVVFSVKSFLVALARQNWACVNLRPMDFAFMAFQAPFVAEAFAVAGCVVADVWANMLVFMSSITV